MTEYTVHFQKGTRVGARSLRMVYVEANDAKAAVAQAKREFTDRAYKIVRVDYFDDDGRRQIA